MDNTKRIQQIDRKIKVMDAIAFAIVISILTYGVGYMDNREYNIVFVMGIVVGALVSICSVFCLDEYNDRMVRKDRGIDHKST